MPLLGKAAVAIWSDQHDPAAHDHWHSHEHLVERMGIPGFLRGRRMIDVEGGLLRYLVLYEVEDTGVLTSPAYLARLNQPSDWTQRTMGANRGLSRTLCTVRASEGRGVGAWMLALTPQARPGQEKALHAWLGTEVVPQLPQQAGLTGAHLLLREGTERPATHEEKLRGRPDASVASLLLVEGYDPETLRRVGKQLLAEDGLTAHGAAGLPTAQLYTLAHVMTSADCC